MINSSKGKTIKSLGVAIAALLATSGQISAMPNINIAKSATVEQSQSSYNQADFILAQSMVEKKLGAQKNHRSHMSHQSHRSHYSGGY